jgi:transposase
VSIRARAGADVEERAVFGVMRDFAARQPPSCSPLPARFKHRAAFAGCNGTAPLPASAGKTHRFNRGGDRQINNAIDTIALIRAFKGSYTVA